MPFLCAVPPTLPADLEGVGASPSAGPYFASEYVPGESVVLERNPFYQVRARATWSGSWPTYGRAARK